MLEVFLWAMKIVIFILGVSLAVLVFYWVVVLLNFITTKANRHIGRDFVQKHFKRVRCDASFAQKFCLKKFGISIAGNKGYLRDFSKIYAIACSICHYAEGTEMFCAADADAGDNWDFIFGVKFWYQDCPWAAIIRDDKLIIAQFDGMFGLQNELLIYRAVGFYQP